jgi:hypothetical protein
MKTAPWPMTALQVVRLVLAIQRLPKKGRIHIVSVDWEAGTFEYVRK